MPWKDALQDLQRAAELLPQDRGIRTEIQTVQRDLRAHREAVIKHFWLEIEGILPREAQKKMFVNVFQPAARAPGSLETCPELPYYIIYIYLII